MKKQLLSGVSVAALLFAASSAPIGLADQANAADLRAPAYKAPPPASAPAFSWTGCYVGAHVGWGWGVNRFNRLHSFSTSGIDTVTGSTSFDSSGGLFGGQVGCNYQFAGWSPWAGSNWVIGVQGDFAGTDINGKGTDPIGDGDETIEAKTQWLASITGRLGLTAFNNQALFYVKGGGAWARTQWDVSNANNDGVDEHGLFKETRSGWTIGGGAEWTLWSPNWTAFVEYNFYDLNRGGTTLNGTFSTCPSTAGTTCNQLTTGKQEIQTVKVGVNYKFW